MVGFKFGIISMKPLTVASSATRAGFSRPSLGCQWGGHRQHECSAGKSAEIMGCNHVYIEQNHKIPCQTDPQRTGLVLRALEGTTQH